MRLQAMRPGDEARAVLVRDDSAQTPPASKHAWGRPASTSQPAVGGARRGSIAPLACGRSASATVLLAAAGLFAAAAAAPSLTELTVEGARVIKADPARPGRLTM